jgi:hypothetical protein
MAQARGASSLSRYSRLGASLAIPVVGLAALVLAVGLTHHPTPTSPPISVATPTPFPTPTLYPALFPRSDSFALLPAQNAFGAIAVPRVTLPGGVSIEMTLAASPANLPSELPVWLLAAQPLDPRTVANRFGISPHDSGDTTQGITLFHAGLGVKPATDAIAWLASGVPAPQLGGHPRDAGTAEVLATRWLLRSGLAPFAGTSPLVEQTSNGESASFSEWKFTWWRRAPVYPLQPAIDSVVARVSADGTLKQLDFSYPRVVEGSTYPLRPWRQAFAEAQQGRWSRPCCQPLPELTTPGTLHVTITSVSLEYAIVATPGALYAVPMYAFSEGAGQQSGLVPAIAT